MQVLGRARRCGQRDRAAHAHLRTVDPRLGAARAHGEGRQGPGGVPGPQPRRRRGPVGLRHPQPLDRPRHAQPACAARLLARGQPQPEHDLSRMLHRRARPCGRPGSAGVPPQADGEPSQAPRGAQCGGGKGGLGHAGAARRLPRPRPADGLRQLRRCLCGSVGERQRQAQDPPHRRRHRPRPCGQSGADRAAGVRLVRVRPLRTPLRRMHRGRRPHRAGEL